VVEIQGNKVWLLVFLVLKYVNVFAIYGILSVPYNDNFMVFKNFSYKYYLSSYFGVHFLIAQVDIFTKRNSIKRDFQILPKSSKGKATISQKSSYL
jgi:hypothetical protein